jgi:hypothetical protein
MAAKMPAGDSVVPQLLACAMESRYARYSIAGNSCDSAAAAGQGCLVQNFCYAIKYPDVVAS